MGNSFSKFNYLEKKTMQKLSFYLFFVLLLVLFFLHQIEILQKKE